MSRQKQMTAVGAANCNNDKRLPLSSVNCLGDKTVSHWNCWERQRVSLAILNRLYQADPHHQQLSKGFISNRIVLLRGKALPSLLFGFIYYATFHIRQHLISVALKSHAASNVFLENYLYFLFLSLIACYHIVEIPLAYMSIVSIGDLRWNDFFFENQINVES